MKKMIWDTAKVNAAVSATRSGVILSNHERPFFEPDSIDIKKGNLAWNFTQEEITEIIKCKNDVIYFAEKFCKIKSEDGSYKHPQLRDYQKEVLRNFENSRYNLLMMSRQNGKCFQIISKIELCYNDNGNDIILNLPFYQFHRFVSKKLGKKINLSTRLKYKLYDIMSWFEN